MPIDFKKRLSAESKPVPTNPVELYDTLDRASDKGPLRPPQLAVLSTWFEDKQDDRDVIVKLHTGQGKTLIGLLLLQARLNQKTGPAVYLCPNNFLIDQTCSQAEQFGIATCTAESDLPVDFLEGRKILVTSVQKLFNGRTRFGLRRDSIDVGTILFDDSHACADAIRAQCKLRIPRADPAYGTLLDLFKNDLEKQGVGTFADIQNKKPDAILPVPYWSWLRSESDVARTLSAGSDRKTIKFAWPLLKDMLGQCQCVVSGSAIEIEPYIAPLSAFGSYSKALHRIFMSATVTDDAFLIKGLRLTAETIQNPLTYEAETWSGEKMVLIPALVDPKLDRASIVNDWAKPRPNRNYGVVVLAPSFARTTDWETLGANVATNVTINDAVVGLQAGDREKTTVLVNRYDGIDLPDGACRILVFDSKPYSESLVDVYQESCRPGSEATLVRTLRTVEQGFGRSVRGEKDFSVIIVIGSDLTRLIRDRANQRFLSPQLSAQIELGRELAKFAHEEIEQGETPQRALNSLIMQCLKRDKDWKAFYAEKMNEVSPVGPSKDLLELYQRELDAELKSQSGDYPGAVEELQALLDSSPMDRADRAWYLQEMARYQYVANRLESERLQVIAFTQNRYLLRPPLGVSVAQIRVVSHGRVERIIGWVKEYSTYEQLNVAVSEILGRLVFGVAADKFEGAFDELSAALGFVGERPDKEWKEGPDNLWALDDTNYLVVECKSEVATTRAEIDKREAEQMNRSSAWFEKHYRGMHATRLIIHPTHKVQSAAAFTHDVNAMRKQELRRLTTAVESFFKSFEAVDFNDLAPAHIQSLLESHGLSVQNIRTGFSKKLQAVPR